MTHNSDRNGFVLAWMAKILFTCACTVPVVVVPLVVAPGVAIADDAPIAQLEKLITTNELEQAVAIGRQIVQSGDASVDTTLPLARLARALQQDNELESAAEFFKHSVEASERDAADRLEFDKKILIRIAAGTTLTQVNRLAEAVDVLEPTLAIDSGAGESQRETVVGLLLRVGSTALANGASEIASRAYALAAEHASDNQHATAMLGNAWAMAIQRGDPLAAAQELASFVEKYPDHADAPRATRAAAECLKQAGRDDDAAQLLADLLERWPDSESAWEIATSHRELAVDLLPSAVKRWLVESSRGERLQKLDSKMLVQGLLAASQLGDNDAWSAIIGQLAQVDQSGQSCSDLLALLSTTGRESDAERLATILISPAEGTTVQASAREAACRWAGRTQRWSMLALAAETESIDVENASRTIAVERLFAESLMQVGRVDEAREWWDTLVDHRQAKDFATLLRCAEAETAAGSDVARAKSRIDAARGAAGNDRFEHALVDLLDAELSIRRSEFDQARALLENVVRSNETDASLRGRAQWLIGETHYLQQAFTDAIEAYRRVEGIDPGGQWISASLVQAGKSFEQLGRAREAAVCYGNLLSRFADTPHAELARRRLAAITPDAGPSSSPSSTTKRR